jgi:hypothetical protein
MVEAYYKQNVTKSSNRQTQKTTKPSKESPNEVVKARGRPRKNSIAPRGRGRPRKNPAPQQALLPKTGQGRRGRPRKVQEPETELN